MAIVIKLTDGREIRLPFADNVDMGEEGVYKFYEGTCRVRTLKDGDVESFHYSKHCEPITPKGKGDL
jgi:hypothetical protein